MRPRFKTERGNMVFINIGKMMIMQIHNIVLGSLLALGLSWFNWSLQTSLLIFFSANIGILVGYLRYRGILPQKKALSLFWLSCILSFAIGLSLDLQYHLQFILSGFFFGIANYASIRYHFSDYENEIREYFKEKDPSRYAVFKVN